ncbi:glycosyltransferase [Chitinophaga silvatica]|uniref:Glycosyltransferase n=1 Tax=Chitinophaga silvatica TaxID=2282649 RepID=A0A3E1Y4Y3_9BACT|nr:glycosyltransferase family 4 protein [Chitinophaga silvatica]RFS19527.1 glycosyltransferase [Chitinophaga silvatica]
MRIKKAILVSFNGKSNAGGVERVVYYLDDYFRSRGITTKIITADLLINRTLFGRLLPLLFRHRHFKKREMIYMSRYASAYLWWARRSNQLVITQGESSAYYPVDIMFLHGCNHAMELAQGHKRDTLSRNAKLQQKGCENAKQIISVSRLIKSEIIHWFNTPADKTDVLFNCVDTSIFYPHPRTNTPERTLMFVGRPVPEKGFAILQQIARTMEQHTGWRLLVVTNKPLEVDYFEGCTKVTAISGLTIDNISREAYAKADMLIVPSVYEGFEMVTLEALSSGIPVIGNEVGGVKELTEQNFPAVFRLPQIAADSPALLQYFDSVLEKFQAAMTPQELHELVKERFGVATYFNQLDELLLKKRVDE